jgi:hypothetical protein
MAGRRAVAVLPALAFCLACDESNPPAGPEAGSIAVTSITTGPDQDDDGYTVMVDGVATTSIDANGSAVIEGIVAGTRMVSLAGVVSNCTAGAGKTVSVTSALRISAEFTVTCVARGPAPPSNMGTLEITTVTTGVERDTDGYSAHLSNLNANNFLLLPSNGTVSVALPAGNHWFIALGDIAGNCRNQTTVSPEVIVDIVPGGTVHASFHVVCESPYMARLAPGSQIAFVRNGAIHVVNSDGTGVVQLTDGPSDCSPSWSPDGLRLAFVRGCGQLSRIHIMDADGSNLVMREAGGNPAWSPDGKRIAFTSMSDGSQGIFVMPADDDGSLTLEVLNRPGWDGDPSWSPDGSGIAFSSDWVFFDFTNDIFVTPVAGGKVGQLTDGFTFWPNLTQYFQPAWSPDGARLAAVRCPQAFYTCDNSSIVLMNSDGSGLTPVVATRWQVRPTWSPDGTVIAFASAGTMGWVRPGTGERGFIVDDGHSPAWRPVPPQ